MALPAVYILLLFSLLPLLQASRCRSGEYCPAGVDCDEDLSLCKSGMCTNGANRSLCDESISIEFTRPMYTVQEGNRQIDAILRINRMLSCCPFSVKVLVEDKSATKNRDYVYPPNGIIEVIFRPKKDTAIVGLQIKEDRISELNEIVKLSIVEVSLPHGFSLGETNCAEIEIIDDDPACLSFERPTYSVSESSRRLSATLRLDIPASYDITAKITTAEMEANEGCDYDEGPYNLQLKAGSTRFSFDVGIIDDDIYEKEPESFNLVINMASPNHVRRCDPFRTTVTITDNDQPISMSFEQSSYTVDEGVGYIYPVLKLSKPAPCCITVRAELTDGPGNDKATGEAIDYGYYPRHKYEYTFSAGETCSTPLRGIPIIDDRRSERNERFTISIIEDSVPFNVRVSRKSVQIIIKDNDICAFFGEPSYEVNEIEGPLEFSLKLDKPAEEDSFILVGGYPFGAAPAAPGRDYEFGPYNVTIKKYRRESEKFAVAVNGSDRYTGNRMFQLTMDIPFAYSGYMPCMPNGVICTILDNEFGVCFDQSTYTVTEGDNVEFVLRPTRPLSSSERTVNLYYGVVDNYPYPASGNSGSDQDYYPTRSFYIDERLDTVRTKSDTTLEHDEKFTIEIDPKIRPDGLFDCITKVVVTIENDDDCTLYFQSKTYDTRNKNELVKPRIMFSNKIDYTIRGYIIKENGSAVEGEDYHVLNENPIEIGPGTYKDLSVDAVDDDVVEMLDEDFTIKLYDADDSNVHIDQARNYTKVTIHDDDICEIQIIQSRLDFSKGIYADCPVRIDYKGSFTTTNNTLPAKETKINLVTEVEKITVCIPDILFDERPPSRYRHNKYPVITSDKRVEIIPFRKC